MILPHIKPKTAEWLEERQKYLGASEAAAAMNLHPHMTANDLFLQKTGQGTPFEGNAQTERGLVLEQGVLMAYATKKGLTLGPEFFAVHPSENWIAATPDGSVEGRKKHIQVKTHNNWTVQDYAPSGVPDGFPIHERIQVVQELAVTENDEADLVVLFAEESELQLLADLVKVGLISYEELSRYILDKMDLRDYTIERDLEMEKGVIEATRPFWFDCVLKRVHPPNSPYRQDNGLIVQATPEEAMLVEDLRNAMYAQFKANNEFERIKSELINCFGEGSGVHTKLGKVTYKKSKDSEKTVVDWEAIARDLGVTDELVKAHTNTVTRKGTRRFLPPTKQWNQEFAENK